MCTILVNFNCPIQRYVHTKLLFIGVFVVFVFTAESFSFLLVLYNANHHHYHYTGSSRWSLHVRLVASAIQRSSSCELFMGGTVAQGMFYCRILRILRMLTNARINKKESLICSSLTSLCTFFFVCHFFLYHTIAKKNTHTMLNLFQRCDRICNKWATIKCHN
jgi:hypothetical protein